MTSSTANGHPICRQTCRETVLRECAGEVDERVSEDGSLRFFPAFGAELSGPSLKLRGAYLEERLRYVTEMGWVEPSSTDEDRYDNHPNTITVIASNTGNDNSFEAGMRLTRVSGLERSLSWSMLQQAPEMRRAILNDSGFLGLLSDVNAQGGIYDLTRLIFKFSRDIEGFKRSKQVIANLIGAGMAATRAPEQQVAWFYLTTTPMKKFLENLGVEVRTIVSGKVSPSDADESHFCVTFMTPAFEYVKRYASTHANVVQGIGALSIRKG